MIIVLLFTDTLDPKKRAPFDWARRVLILRLYCLTPFFYCL